MSTTTETIQPAADEAARLARRARLDGYLNRADKTLGAIGLSWIIPIIRLAMGDNPRAQLGTIANDLLIPIAGVVAFLIAWGVLAPQVHTSLGAIPGPAQVYQQAQSLWTDHAAERAKADDFYARQKERNAKLVADGQSDRVHWRKYTGRPTYIDQIATSLGTVALGFIIATLVAVPLGIASGLSRTVNGALNPLIQIFKPVSPLAWLPIVTMIVSALYLNPSDALPKSLVISAVTVTLCSLWPTLINTALGVASVDKDLVNVSKVLRLPTSTTVRKIILPSSLPLIFTGLRLSLGVGWMVLIAAEMLAQNPGSESSCGTSSRTARRIRWRASSSRC